MPPEDRGAAHLAYLEFELEVGLATDGTYPVSVIRSPSGEARARSSPPFDEQELKVRLLRLENALLGGRGRRVVSGQLQEVEEFGAALFQTLFTGNVLSCYDLSVREAQMDGKGLRIKLRIDPPELAVLPWEFLFDPRSKEFLCLSRYTPIVRYLDLPQPARTLSVPPPLRMLGMVSSPDDLPSLDVEAEQRRVEEALGELRADGRVEVTWLPGSIAELQRALRVGTWHIFHFVGHGVFDTGSDEGHLAFRSEFGTSALRSATDLGILLGDHPTLRLVVLNACEGARGGEQDVISSSAAVLVKKGIPAVLAMQYEISDRAAVQFARAFYSALTDRVPVDAAVSEARKALRLEEPNRLEWGTPVLYMRSPNGVLFNLRRPKVVRTDGAEAPPDGAEARTDGADADDEPPKVLASMPTATTVGEGTRAIPLDTSSLATTEPPPDEGAVAVVVPRRADDGGLPGPPGGDTGGGDGKGGRGRRPAVVGGLIAAVAIIVVVALIWALTHHGTPAVLPTHSPAPTHPSPSVSPSVSPTVPTPTPSVSPQLLFSDDFADQKIGWATGSFGSCDIAYVGASYTVSVSKQNWLCNETTLFNASLSFGSVWVEADATLVSGSNGSIGLNCRKTDARYDGVEFYGDGTYLYFSVDGDGFHQLSSGTFTGVSLGTTYRLALHCVTGQDTQGNPSTNLYAFLDNNQQGSATDPQAPAKGAAGVLVGTGSGKSVAEGEFDNFQVWTG